MRIYITSRNRTPSSASPSDFYFALERRIELPEAARGYIDSCTASNTWESVLAGVNQTLYVKWNTSAQQTLVLDPGTYRVCQAWRRSWQLDLHSSTQACPL